MGYMSGSALVGVELGFTFGIKDLLSHLLPCGKLPLRMKLWEVGLTLLKCDIN